MRGWAGCRWWRAIRCSCLRREERTSRWLASGSISRSRAIHGRPCRRWRGGFVVEQASAVAAVYDRRDAEPLDESAVIDRRYRLPTGALIGYLGYGLRRFVERVPARLADDLNMPDAWFGVYDRLLVFDHETGRATIVSTGVDELGRPDAERARRRMEEWLALLAEPTVLPPRGSHLLIPVGRGVPPSRNGGGDETGIRLGGTPRPTTAEQFEHEPELRANMTRDDYERAVRRILDYIAAGDVYQINFTQRFEATTSARPALLYHALRTVNPAPFAAYLDCGVGQVLSSSPERFLRIRGREIQTRPIKGTRARTGNEQADQKAAR
ncbi:MAG: hypothetical protein FJ388_26925, partial [Verrucomicrobia bacterium]|nr:hypothetical protein [Verrucomicrobiota bacterium]